MLAVVAGLGFVSAFAQEHTELPGDHGTMVASEHAAGGAPAEHADHKLPSAAPVLYYGLGGHPPTDPANPKTAKFGPLALTNSMLVTWIVAIGIILFARYATKNIKQVPDGAQNFWEFLVEGLRNFLEGIIGRHLTKKTYWFFATVFIFILFTNWFGLLPGVGTIGWGTPDAAGNIGWGTPGAHGNLQHIS